VLAATSIPVRPTWKSLASAFQVPEWFRDAKFGIWAHWGPQCVPEAGDWYGRLMYVQGQRAYDHHLRHYGHPSRTGFIDIIGRWKAEAWQPERLVDLYRKAGARYFVAMANHHDNFDNFASAHHGWNSVQVGPKRDIVGTWARAARGAGLRFGVSNHSSHAWHWWQTAYGYDAEGPMRAARYDAFRLRRRDGRGKYWAGLDPQDLYGGPAFVPPDGIDSIEAMDSWHDARDGQWHEELPAQNPAFARKWLLRQMDLVEKYRPDLVYFDDTALPFGTIGLEAAAHFYNQSIAHHGRLEGVLTAKRLSATERAGIVEDVERGFVDDIQARPWQADTCIGNWHYDRALYERHGYKSARQVVQRLCDVVSKNGNLLLSIPVRGDGSIDADEAQILTDLSGWFAFNGEAIHGSRPWRLYGEGSTRPKAGAMNEGEAPPFTSADIRFTTRDGAVYAAVLEWPEGTVAIGSLGIAAFPEARVEHVDLLGYGPLDWVRDRAALRVTFPGAWNGIRMALPVLRIRGGNLA
jgi:alpha-L-fucosidase